MVRGCGCNGRQPWAPPPRHPHTQCQEGRPPGQKEHTAVRTDEDSGFDTLWLLKKMDSRSEKAKTGRSQG